MNIIKLKGLEFPDLIELCYMLYFQYIANFIFFSLIFRTTKAPPSILLE